MKPSIPRALEDKALNFLRLRADPNVCDKKGASVLLHVVGKTDADFVQQLVNLKADPLRNDKELDCPLFRAAEARQLDVMRVLLGWWSVPTVLEEDEEAQAEARQREQRERMEMLNESLVKQIPEMSAMDLREMLTRKADLNWKAKNGWTPLTLATFYRREDLVGTLVRSQDAMKGVKLSIQSKNAQGRAPLHLAARKDLAEIAKILAPRQPFSRSSEEI